MSIQVRNGKPEEQKLVKLYMDLTGQCESCARGVYMYVSSPESAPAEPVTELTLKPAPAEEPGDGEGASPRRPLPHTVLALVALGLSLTVAPVAAATGPAVTNTFITSPISLADAVNLALAQNPTVLRARKDLESTLGIAIQTRAIALPTLGINGSFGAVQRTDIDTFATPGVTFGTPQNWSSQVRIVQNFYQGGRMLSALRAANLSKQQSVLNYQTALADTVVSVQVAYYDVLLAAQQITVQEASVELLTRELADTTRRFDAGTVPRFNVLRAEVELANARPRLINARHRLSTSRNSLANLLGFNIPRETSEEIPLTLSGRLDAEPYDLELPRAINLALEKRTELGALRAARALRQEDLINAKAGYKPILQGYVGYDFHNSMLSQDLSVEDHGWIAGVQLTWNLFDGRRTQGRIQEAAANSDRAGIDLDDSARRIELEVRTAFSNFIEAREVLESQKKVQEQAEEALRLARARNEAGTGTQLDVLSAQTALTEARTTQIQALHDYAAARARLQRAVGMNVPSEAIEK
ncbi:MAG TPA: TolC family protein [Candidatus Acidoferrum sp.]|jgi:outer membrane protein|nr:TolC family protein [Candidatus Acidoferrum sp.]